MCFKSTVVIISLLQKLVRRLPNFFMEEGHWFVSVYNDDGDEHNVVLVPQNSQVTLAQTLYSVAQLKVLHFVGVNGGMREWMPRAWGLRPWKVSVPSRF